MKLNRVLADLREERERIDVAIDKMERLIKLGNPWGPGRPPAWFAEPWFTEAMAQIPAASAERSRPRGKTRKNVLAQSHSAGGTQ